MAINFQTEEFGRFNKNIEALLAELRQSNEISGELRDQLVSELRAGREIISGPKPQRDLLDLLLVKPSKMAGGEVGDGYRQQTGRRCFGMAFEDDWSHLKPPDDLPARCSSTTR